MSQQLELALLRHRPDALPIRRPPTRGQYRFNPHVDRTLLPRTSLTLDMVASALRMAETGDVERMCDLYESRVEADAHLRAAIENRNESVALKTWTIAEGGDTAEDKRAAAELERRLRLVPGFADTLSHQLSFAGWGWAGSEIDWQLVDGMATPVYFDDVAHRRFRFATDTDDLRLRTGESSDWNVGNEGLELAPGKWWVTYRGRGRLTATGGFLRTAVWWSTFKTMAARDWLVFADRFGMPYVTGEYDEEISDEDKEILRQAVQDLGSDGWAIFSSHAKMVIHEARANTTGGNAAEGVHGALITLCDMQVSKLIEGATLVSAVQGPGSYALGEVHQNRYHDILEGDAEKISESFQHCVGYPFVKFNGLNARPPRLKIHLRLNLTLRDQITMALDMANRLEGFELDEEQIRGLTLLRRPLPGSKGLRGVDVAKILAQAEQAKAAAKSDGGAPAGEGTE